MNSKDRSGGPANTGPKAGSMAASARAGAAASSKARACRVLNLDVWYGLMGKTPLGNKDVLGS